MSRKVTNLLPQVSFSILLALSLKERHGYELMQQVEQDSKGIVRIGPGALYGAIKQLHEDGLIEEVESSDERRRSYRLTKRGRERLGSELRYFESAVKLALQRGLGSTKVILWTN